MSAIEVGSGISKIWVVMAIEHDHSGDTELLAAYDGEHGEEQAKALISLIKQAGATKLVTARPVDLWPLLRAP